jgi:hypothetical protein
MAEADLSKPIIRHVTRSDFAVARSNVLDAFAALEFEVTEALKILELGTSCESALFGQKLDKLATLVAGPTLSKASVKIITEAATKSQSLCEIRNDLVHSRLRYIPDHPAIAIYFNARTIAHPYPIARAMTVTQHQTLAKETNAVAVCIKTWRCSAIK